MIKLINNGSGFSCEGCIYFKNKQCEKFIFINEDEDGCNVDTIFIDEKAVENDKMV